MKQLNKELIGKTNEELAILVFRLKLQLLEFRFKKQSGEFDKQHLVKEIRKTIAVVLTILKSRNIDVTIGTHGISMYDRKNNTVTSLNKQANEVMNETSKSFESPEDKTGKAKNVVSSNINKIIDAEDKSLRNIPAKDNIINNAKMKNERKAGPIRKTQGGGQ
ncbi:MAG: hypothetical protein Ta2E_07830 [Mycoplasmoidaceae bacterium]|nr:MAG: hypothetical protein Ta2E_07640 [Mycoplasmoidaceae bacterium]GMO16533.1 MAG: hypothetical protein Ta2E_07830 [Mycoplasmoidaceae bacterium]